LFQSRAAAGVPVVETAPPESPTPDARRVSPTLGARVVRPQAASAEAARDARAVSATRSHAPIPARARTKKTKDVRAARTPVRTPLVAAPAAATVAVAAAAPPPVVVASAPPPPPPPPAAVGPFFEMGQVNQPPRVVSQVEPRLPDHQGGSDVVVLRVLVSQAGHASTIALLRRSKAGRPVDDAVAAAVKQWTFTPARKRGQNVSCWFNVAVPLK
jgi:protein TonB